MYCIKCGVRLVDTEKSCPLCATRVYHPEIPIPAATPLYPADRSPTAGRHSKGAAVFLTAVVVLAAFAVVLCDLQLHRALSWSGYVLGGLGVFYTALVLPLWFCRPNPVIFLPCAFAAGILYLLYIDLTTGGGWFLSFAFPVAGGTGLIVTTLVTLLRYVPRGKLYITGGCVSALGGFMLLMEFLLGVTFHVPFVGWSVYPMAALMLLGGFLIFLGICRPARETMERKFFF